MVNRNKSTGSEFELRTEENARGEVLIRIISRRGSKRPGIAKLRAEMHDLMMQLFKNRRSTSSGFDFKTEELAGGEVIVKITPKKDSTRPRITVLHAKLHSLMVQLYSPS